MASGKRGIHFMALGNRMAFFKGGYPSRLRPFSGPVFCVDLQPIHSDQDHQGDLGS